MSLMKGLKKLTYNEVISLLSKVTISDENKLWKYMCKRDFGIKVDENAKEKYENIREKQNKEKMTVTLSFDINNFQSANSIKLMKYIAKIEEITSDFSLFVEPSNIAENNFIEIINSQNIDVNHVNNLQLFCEFKELLLDE